MAAIQSLPARDSQPDTPVVVAAEAPIRRAVNLERVVVVAVGAMELQVPVPHNPRTAGSPTLEVLVRPPTGKRVEVVAREEQALLERVPNVGTVVVAVRTLSQVLQ